METQLVYLDDFGIVKCTAQVISVTKMEDKRTSIILDKTCFYPRGGGQDWDTGNISTTGSVFNVDEVRLDDKGEVHHVGRFVSGKFDAGDEVACAVDLDRRTINTRLHSAGHVVDLAVDHFGLGWPPVRGAHYPHMSFVEYEAEATPEQTEDIGKNIQFTVDKVVTSAPENEIRFMSVADMHTICRHVPANIPTNKPARVVIYNSNYGIPCGGTHVKTLGEIGKVVITKVKSKKGLTKVSYSIEGIN